MPAGMEESLSPPPSPLRKDLRVTELYKPGSFDPASHFYPRVLNAQIHPLVRSFLGLGNERIAKRYVHLHPAAKPEAVQEALSYACKYFQWGGADLFSVTTEKGQKRFVVIETNSCPSGQKSMPMENEDLEHAGYKTLLEKAFLPVLKSGKWNGEPIPEGILAVLYDKNQMEASGYAAALADLTGEEIYLTPCYADEPEPKWRWRPDGILEINIAGAVQKAQKEEVPIVMAGAKVSRTSSSSSEGKQQCSQTNSGAAEPQWRQVRGAIRYVTQRPWTRIPPVTRTMIFNPVLACLAGGRNKAVGAKAYDLHNAALASTGLSILTPETIWDVAKPEIPLWVGRMGGLAVVKVPYANAGQGVWTITNDEELKEFMAIEQRYDRFIVQALIGNNGWSSQSVSGRLYHVGTIPTSKGNIYASDLRMMVGSGAGGFFPVAIYARRAKLPLAEKLESGIHSWDMLGTNLSYKNPDGTWGTETDRLLLMDSRDFNRLGVGVDDLIEAYMQTILAVTAIDRLCGKLITPKGNFGLKLFGSLNPDVKLLDELYTLPLHSLPLEGTSESSCLVKRAADQATEQEDALAQELQLEVTVAAPPGKRGRVL
ncbi:unnamed protein product [Closterium sp. NIES-53]